MHIGAVELIRVRVSSSRSVLMSRQSCFYTELADIYMQLVCVLLMFIEGLWALSLVYYGLISFECQNLSILDVLVREDFDIVHWLPLRQVTSY